MVCGDVYRSEAWTMRKEDIQKMDMTN